MSRNLERSVARALYAKFAKKWRQEKRMANVYGEPGYKRPNFSEWFASYKESLAKKNEAPAYVQEQLSLEDPWLEAPPVAEKAATEERGVVTLNIAGNEDE